MFYSRADNLEVDEASRRSGSGDVDPYLQMLAQLRLNRESGNQVSTELTENKETQKKIEKANPFHLAPKQESFAKKDAGEKCDNCARLRELMGIEAKNVGT